MRSILSGFHPLHHQRQIQPGRSRLRFLLHRLCLSVVSLAQFMLRPTPKRERAIPFIITLLEKVKAAAKAGSGFGNAPSHDSRALRPNRLDQIRRPL